LSRHQYRLADHHSAFMSGEWRCQAESREINQSRRHRGDAYLSTTIAEPVRRRRAAEASTLLFPNTTSGNGEEKIVARFVIVLCGGAARRLGGVSSCVASSTLYENALMLKPRAIAILLNDASVRNSAVNYQTAARMLNP